MSIVLTIACQLADKLNSRSPYQRQFQFVDNLAVLKSKLESGKKLGLKQLS